ncbi:hypothetical protein VNO77_15078 [Canavalia gladiata]|uniref:Uncharacterized protein n=1 Tax=Canavalia gladiata TaxID=3824 RepID=A0AAN9LZ79_CANGL
MSWGLFTASLASVFEHVQDHSTTSHPFAHLAHMGKPWLSYAAKISIVHLHQVRSSSTWVTPASRLGHCKDSRRLSKAVKVLQPPKLRESKKN